MHLVDLLHAKREGGVVVEVVRLGLHLAPGVDAAHVGDALKQLQQERRLGSVDGALGKVARDGAAEGEDARELVARHHLLVRQAALGLEHGQGVGVVLRREVLDVQAVRGALPEALLARTAPGEDVRVAALQDAHQARAQVSLQTLDGTRILKLFEDLALELAVGQPGGLGAPCRSNRCALATRWGNSKPFAGKAARIAHAEVAVRGRSVGRARCCRVRYRLPRVGRVAARGAL